jgi:predicted RNA-binding protein with PUA-like domain
MNYWLIKTEPDTFSWDDLVQKKQEHWDGVRNFQARNHIMTMKLGDLCLFYHSNMGKEVIGIAEVVKEYYPDHTAEDGTWYMMDVAPVRQLKRPVTLAEVKADERLAQMKLVTNSRLSVQPVTPEEFEMILAMSET